MRIKTFGIEVEAYVPSGMVSALKISLSMSFGQNGWADQFTSHKQRGEYKVWTLHYDGSLKTNSKITGVELVSPVFNFDEFDKAMESISLLLESIRAVGGFVNKQCGLHIHVGTVDSISLNKMHYINYNWLKWQDDIFAHLPSHRRCNKYCKRNDSIYDLLSDRYRALNFTSLLMHETLEFRLFAASLNYYRVVACIKLVRDFMHSI